MLILWFDIQMNLYYILLHEVAIEMKTYLGLP